MENKQLDTKDLLMNKKEELIWRVIDNVISCCAVTRIDGAKSITREDVVGKSREENVVLNRCLVVEQMVHAGFTIPNHTFRAMGVAGIMVINFNAATTTATGFDIMVNNNTLPLLASDGDPLTALTAGLHIIVFDKQNNKLQLIV